MKLTQNVMNLQALNFLHGLNLRIAILGGTFNPAHEGHLKISMEAINFYKFDYVIWLVANQNPLKSKNKKSIFTRAEQALKVANHPRIIVSVAEHDLGCYYIYDSLKYLIGRFPTIKFSWLMGIDGIANFRKWYRYQDITNMCDIIVFDRPVPTRLVNNCSFGRKMEGVLAKTQTHNIIIHRKSLCTVSSTKIRANE